MPWRTSHVLRHRRQDGSIELHPPCPRPMMERMDLIAARSKLEAVTRISSIAGASPESLGPGSKERKSVLVNAARSLDLRVDPSKDKIDVAEQICASQSIPW